MYLIIDIGSNTVRAVIFRVDGNKIVPVVNKKYPAGLANYIDKDGLMNEEGVTYLIEILKEIKIVIDAFPLDGVYPFATASLRNIDNSKNVLDMVRDEVGLNIELLSGKKEAYYDYYASIRTSDEDTPQGILADIGGGSTEIVIHHDNQPILTESLPIGSLNMFNKYAKNIIPSKNERKRIYSNTLECLKKQGLSNAIKNLDIELNLLCGVGGSCRSALKLFNSINHKRDGNSEFDVKFLNKIYTEKYTNKELAETILKTSPERIHTLIPGAMIIKAVADCFEIKNIRINTHGVREGYLYYKLEKAGVINA